jgi:sugar phosphate isomerase/epimerase
LGSPQQCKVYPGLTLEQAWDYSVATIQATLDRAEEQGAYLCMEPLASFITDFVTTVAEGLRIVERVNHPNFQLMIDVRSASYDEEPIPELIRKSAAHLMHIHANDDNGKEPGTGHADYPGIAAALKAIGYDGYVSVEVFHFEEGPEAIATSSLKALQSYFD